MSTNLRPELSPKNKFHLERHRYYELKHFCLQYPIWQKAYAALDGFSSRSGDLTKVGHVYGIRDPTAKCAEAKDFYYERMKMVEECASKTDPVIGDYILRGVTEGLSYDHLNARKPVPCCKDTYYELYRMFFWLLSKERK